MAYRLAKVVVFKSVGFKPSLRALDSETLRGREKAVDIIPPDCITVGKGVFSLTRFTSFQGLESLVVDFCRAPHSLETVQNVIIILYQVAKPKPEVNSFQVKESPAEPLTDLQAGGKTC